MPKRHFTLISLIKMFNFIKTYHDRKFYAQFIGKGDLCFDIGANIGVKSKLFLSLGAKVIAFEPQSNCREALQKLKTQNPKFEFYRYAVGAENEEKELFLANHSEVATLSDKFIDYFTCEEIYWNQKETVEVKTLDSLIDRYGLPHFCKIDAEGYETEILLSLTSKISIIEFEFTGGFITETIKIITHLKAENITFNYILNEHLKLQHKEWLTADEMIKIIKTLPTNRLHGNLFAKTNDNK